MVVSVSPSTTGSLATYTISNLHASAPMTAGSSTVTLEGPPGTVFPNSPRYYTLQDSTTPSGSGPVTASLTGGGTNDVTMTVPGNISAGDLLTLTVEDVINPSSASSAYSLTLLGNVTGPSPGPVSREPASVTRTGRLSASQGPTTCSRGVGPPGSDRVRPLGPGKNRPRQSPSRTARHQSTPYGPAARHPAVHPPCERRGHVVRRRR